MKKINFILLSIFFISLAFLGTDAYANEFEWTSYEALNQGNGRSIFFGDGKFIALSANGNPRVAVSTDGGESWVPPTNVPEGWLVDGVYAKGIYLIGGDVGKMFRSTDGMNWTQVPTPAPQRHWGSLTYGKGRFVALTYNDYGIDGTMGTKQIITSTDGISWTDANSVENAYWTDIAYGGGRFVAVRDGGNPMFSTDGINWTSSNPIAEINEWASVTYGNGRFVAVSADGTHQIMTSTNGKTWTLIESPVQNSWQSIAYGDGYFVAISTAGWGSNEDTSKAVMISSDGINWTAEDTPDLQWYYEIAYGDGKFVAVSWAGHGGASNKVLVGELINKGGNSSSSNIFGTRFCSAGVTTFCRPQNGFTNNNPLISIYTELLGLYQQLLFALQNENS